MSTVSREVARHGGRPLYRASEADQQAWESALRPKRCLLAMHAKLQEIVASKLILDWSPEQDFRMAEERVSRGREHARVPRNHLPQPVHSSARSAEKGADSASSLQAADPPLAARAGYADTHRVRSSTPFPSGNGLRKSRTAPFPAIGKAICIGGTQATVTSPRWWNVIRVSVMLVKVPSKDTATVVAALSQHVRKLPASLRRSLTWDRGLEMAQHKSFTVATECEGLLLRSAEPWQRGSNENTNGLLRQYFPKKQTCPAIRRQNWTRSLCD